MSKICNQFETFYEAWNAPIGALCFLLTGHRADSRDVAFQTFLRLGGAKDPEIGKDEARMLLFSSAVRLCDDYYLKKLRKPHSRKTLEMQALPFPVTDAVCALLRLPFRALRLYRGHRAACQEYSDRRGEFTSIEFWNRYLGL